MVRVIFLGEAMWTCGQAVYINLKKNHHTVPIETNLLLLRRQENIFVERGREERVCECDRLFLDIKKRDGREERVKRDREREMRETKLILI